MAENNKVPASAVRRYEISQADLPLCCPMPNMLLWNAHPRVYLPIEEARHMACPYCGTVYILKDEAIAQG